MFGGRDPVWLDANGDGFLDGIGTEGGGILNHLFLNDGPGHWKKQEGSLFGNKSTGNAFSFVDGDGDGNLGGGQFVEARGISGNRLARRFGDVYGRSTLDMVTAQGSSANCTATTPPTWA